MRKISKLVLASALVFLASCDGIGHGAEKVSIKDFEWTIQEGIVFGERYITCNFTNNSDYTIYEFELTLTPNKKMTDKVLNEFYDFYQKEYQVSDEDMEYTKEHGKLRLTCSLYQGYDDPLEAGETFENERCCYYGYRYAKNIDYAQYFKEDMILYRYLDNGMLYTTYYDFNSKKYSHGETESL